MLLSMTGYGAGQVNQDDISFVVEVRTVNNRYLKLNCRLPDGYAAVESRIESLVRHHVRRGTVQLNVDVKRAPSSEDYQINAELVRSYHRQLQQLQLELGDAQPVRLESLLLLPDAIREQNLGSFVAENDWSLMEPAVTQALVGLCEMRDAEGAAMARDLSEQCQEISQCTDEISARAPLVVDAYQRRLTERLNKLLEEHDVEVQPADVVREMGMFAERADVAEEIVRLRSHLDQFVQIMNQEEESAGRKLEFLVQELLRETNTIGSKANDAEIAKQVVQVKTCLERIREMVQNVE